MRKIEQQIISAIQNKKNFTNGERDSIIWASDNMMVVELWHNTITILDKNILVLSNHHYNTQTTISRLNAVTAALNLPLTFRIKNGETILMHDGKVTEERALKINGLKITVKI